jgi:hypothetical protein
LAWEAGPYALRALPGAEPDKAQGRYLPTRQGLQMGDAQVRQASVHKLIRRALRDHYAAVMAEPIPQHWVDMLNRLAEQGPKTRQAQSKQDREFGNSMS